MHTYYFDKVEGLGNDFVMMDNRAGDLTFSEDEVRLLCDRHFGIGADGLILLQEATVPEADFAWHYVNADGSVAEMCGNGIRCLAAYLIAHGLIDSAVRTLTVETRAGLKSISLERDADGLLASAAVAMGRAQILNEKLPVQRYELVSVSLGNPHAVLFVDDAAASPVTTLGPVLETDVAFPHKTNVEFAEVVSREAIRLRVWERGVGETLACGTGACATAAAAFIKGLVEPHVKIMLPGGELIIDIEPATLEIRMTGPARVVYQGEIQI